MKAHNLKAYIFVGLPGSGKSTKIRELVYGREGEFVIVSTDDEIQKYAESQGLRYSDVFKDYFKTANRLAKENLRDGILAGKNIVWDQTNMTSKKRHSILQQIPKRYEKVAVVVLLEREELHRRLAKRAVDEGKYIPKEIVDNMAGNFEMPTIDEGFNDVIVYNNMV